MTLRRPPGFPVSSGCLRADCPLLTMKTPPLPPGWKLDNGWLVIPQGTGRPHEPHVLRKDGTLDRMKIADYCDSYGESEYATGWRGTEDLSRQLADAKDRIARLEEALRDCLESLRRLPDVDGAFRATCIHQAESLLP